MTIHNSWKVYLMFSEGFHSSFCKRTVWRNWNWLAASCSASYFAIESTGRTKSILNNQSHLSCIGTWLWKKKQQAKSWGCVVMHWKLFKQLCWQITCLSNNFIFDLRTGILNRKTVYHVWKGMQSLRMKSNLSSVVGCIKHA